MDSLDITRRRGAISLSTAVAIASLVIVAAASTFALVEFSHLPKTGVTSEPASRTSGASSSSDVSSSNNTQGSTSQSTSTITATADSQQLSCSENCSVAVEWSYLTTPYQSLASMASSSEYVIVGNVTGAWTVSVRGDTPIELYNITTVMAVKGSLLNPNDEFTVGEVGGAAGNKTITLDGYPTLHVGSEYVLFLYTAGGVCCNSKGEVTLPNSPFNSYVEVSDQNALVFMTQGGPQGLFYVQDGNVYSLDNMYPQADAWLPTKVSGVPLTQFVEEIQSAATTSTLSSTSTKTNTESVSG